MFKGLVKPHNLHIGTQVFGLGLYLGLPLDWLFDLLTPFASPYLVIFCTFIAALFDILVADRLFSAASLFILELS